jgi:hypothetical protein
MLKLLKPLDVIASVTRHMQTPQNKLLRKRTRTISQAPWSRFSLQDVRQTSTTSRFIKALRDQQRQSA